MTNLMSAHTRACLTTTLATSVALMATASIANAKSRHHDNDAESNGASPHFVITGQPANVKRVLRERKDKNKEAKCKKKNCEKPMPEKPVADGPAGHPKRITISNGVTTYTLPFDPRFSVEVTKPGSITVHSGDTTVTLPGGSITVHGQAVSTSLADRAGLQEIINSRGDAVFAIKPPPPAQNSPTPVKSGSNGQSVGGVLDGVVDAGKAIGNGIESIGLGFISLGGPTPPPPTGTIIQE
jgi:hypothetical protein